MLLTYFTTRILFYFCCSHFPYISECIFTVIAYNALPFYPSSALFAPILLMYFLTITSCLITTWINYFFIYLLSANFIGIINYLFPSYLLLFYIFKFGLANFELLGLVYYSMTAILISSTTFYPFALLVF